MPTTKNKPVGRSRSLSKEVVVEAAVGLMESAGESAFSLRKLGELVGCDPMAVLYHFKSKEGLLRAMADWLTARLQPVNEAQPWQDRLRDLAAQYRRLALGYPHTFSLMQRFLNTGISDYRHIEMVYRALSEAGLDENVMPAVCVGWYSTVYGLSMAEIGGLIRTPTNDQVGELDQMLSQEYPIMRRLLPHFAELDPKRVFTIAHDAFLKGIQTSVSVGME